MRWPFLESRRQIALLIVFATLLSTAVLVYRNSLMQLNAASDVLPTEIPPRPWQSIDDFDLSHALVPADQIRSGGPPVDGIPAISDPMLVSAEDATFLRPPDPVIGVTLGKEARAYPLRILDSFEVVNDQIGDVPFAVTYCPLCDSSVVFDRRHQGETLEFGVSGRLYNSNVLMYDRPYSSKSTLWSQVRSGAITGPRAGESLQALPLEVVAWEDWRLRHPETRVLATEILLNRVLGMSQYSMYFDSPELMFPVEPLDERLPNKTPIIGVWGPETQRAYPIGEFEKDEQQVTLPQELDGMKFSLLYEPGWNSLRIVDADEGLQWLYSYWFAWTSLREGTEIFVHDARGDPP